MRRLRFPPPAPRPLLAAWLAAVLAGGALAHDAWLVPGEWVPAPGQGVPLRIWVGHPGDANELPRDDEAVTRFAAAVAGEAEIPVPGLHGGTPAGVLPASFAAPAVVGYESGPFPSELPADRFHDYLAEEGLEPIVEERRRRGEHASPGREVFFRSASTLVGDGSVGTGAPRPMGLALELVLDRWPGPGEGRLEARALWRGEPLGGLLVELWRLDETAPRAVGRTDGEGRLELTVGPGAWLLAGTHMVRCDDGLDLECGGAEWASIWASLTFAVPSAVAPGDER